MAVVMDVVAEEDAEEGDIVINHMNSPAGIENLCQMPVYTLHNNGGSSPINKIII